MLQGAKRAAAAAKGHLEKLTGAESVSYQRIPGAEGKDEEQGQVRNLKELAQAAEILSTHSYHGVPDDLESLETDAGPDYTKETLRRGVKGWNKDVDATIQHMKDQIPERNKRELWWWHAVVTLGCTIVTTLIADIPESTSKNPNVPLNFAVDLSTYALYVFLLPKLLHTLTHAYADTRMSGVHSAMSRPNAAKHMKDLSELRMFRSDSSYMRFYAENHIQHNWTFSQRYDYKTWVHYVAMKICQTFDSKFTKTLILMTLPVLMAKMPLATEETGKFRVGNLMWEVAASWTVLMFHSGIRSNIVTPLAWLSARVSYMAFYAGRWAAESACYGFSCIKLDAPSAKGVSREDEERRRHQEFSGVDGYQARDVEAGLESPVGKEGDSDDGDHSVASYGA